MNTRTLSPYSPRHSGASTPLYFSDTDFNLSIQAAEMTESSIHVKYRIDEDPLNVNHHRMSGARRKKIKRLIAHGYGREEALEKILENLQQDGRLSDTSLPSPDIKTDYTIPPSTRVDLSKPVHKDIMKHYKMGGARRKRYRWLIMHGYDKEEAIVKSAFPMNGDKNQTENHSRNRFEENLNALKRKNNSARNFFMTKGNKEVTKSVSHPKPIVEKEICVQIGIFPAAFPEVRFQKEEFEALQDCLSEHILKDTVSMPQFRGTVCKNGWLQITCANMTAVEWVKDVVPFLKPWKGAKLNVLKEKDFPKPMNLICFLPKSSTISNECILDYLQKQNPENLDIGSWKVLYREDTPDMTKVVISIDDASALLLTKDGVKLYYMLGSVNFMVVNAQLYGPENGPNLIYNTVKSMEQGKRESIAGPSWYISESPSKINNTSYYESRLQRKNIGPSIKLNEYNIPDTNERFERDLNCYTSNHNYDGYATSTNPLRNVRQDILLLEDHLRHDRRVLDVELELERKRSQSYTQRRSRSPRRYYDDHRPRDRDREGNRRGSNSLASFPRRY